ncbi:MAG TPA: hypothetical protein VI278_18490 [Nitrososphaeraceae archaeon]
MTKRIQDGIYYNKTISDSFQRLTDISNQKNKTFALLFLRVKEGRTAREVGACLANLWMIYDSLRRGFVKALRGYHVPSGGLDVLIGYGPKIFDLQGVKKKIPNDLCGRQFSPSTTGEEPIIRGAGIRYASDLHDNVGLIEHVVIQFISATQLATYRAIAETWQFFSNDTRVPFVFTSFYTGFQRDDGRSWLGFHDEVSNMKNAQERKGIIAIHKKWNHLIHDDFWTENGTYLAFLRIAIDLKTWENIQSEQQELLVGRDKISGRPIIAVDKRGNPILDETCPTIDELNGYSPKFHDHPNYFLEPNVKPGLKSTIDVNASLKILNLSHIGRTRHIEEIDCRDPSSNRIFRQGFEFIESTNDPAKPVRVGLNFVSFQNDPRRLFSLLANPHWLGNSNFGGDGSNNNMNGLFSVNAAGIFLVPPVEKPFPGCSIFI